MDRRRIKLIEPGMSAAPIHYESSRLDVAATTALVAKVRASVVRATSAALDEIATALPAPVLSISLRAWPLDFPDDIAVQRRAPYTVQDHLKSVFRKSGVHSRRELLARFSGANETTSTTRS